MRIKAVHIAGLAVALVGGVTKDALADPPVQTNGSDVNVASGTTITAGASQAAIEVNTNNNVTNAGALTSKDADSSTGILLDNNHSGTIASTGTISLTETYALSDTDNDGDLDGPWAQGSNRNGILLNAGAAFTGNITTSGAITIAGNSSAGINLQGPLTGALNVTSGIALNGDNSTAILIGPAGGVSGVVNVNSTIAVSGQGSSGIVVDAPIGGGLNVNGAVTVTGFHTVQRPADTSHLDLDDTELGGPAIAVHANVTGGVTLQGIGVQNDVDDDGDGITEAQGDTNDNQTVSVAAYGSAPAVLIQANSGTITLTQNAKLFGLDVRGSILASGIYNGVVAHAIQIGGNLGTTTNILGGIALDRSLVAGSVEADAYGLLVGAGGTTPEVKQRGAFTVSTTSEGAFNAYGMYFDANSNVGAVTNTGAMFTQVLGETGNATAITDLSGNLTTITNTGTLVARVLATDSDPTDNIPPPPVTGSATAIDVSSHTAGQGVTFNQTARVPFTDDDGVDDDAVNGTAAAIKTVGDIIFGAGDDHLNLLAGTITGNVAFGDGANTMSVDNGATFTGQISTSGAQNLSMHVINGTLSLTGGTTNIHDATFDSTGTLKLVLGSTQIAATNTVVFQPGSHLNLAIPTGLPTSGSYQFLTGAGGVTFSASVSLDGAPYIYDLNVTENGANTALTATFNLKTPTELGLSSNQAAAFTPIINALRTNSTASDALSSLTTAKEFNTALGQLMPTYASASTELAATAIQQQQSATTNRLSLTRLNDLNEVSAWAQEIGYVLDRDPQTPNGDRFRGHGFGMALGIDGPLNNGALFGLSGSFLTSDAEEPIRPDGSISSSFLQGNAYLGTAVGAIDLDVVGGLGIGRMRERRVVEFGGFSGEASAKWWSYEGHGMIRASMPLHTANWLVITPEASLTYVGLEEQGYTEERGGTALDVKADSAFSQRLWADAGIEFSSRFSLGGDSVFAPRLYVGYRANALDNATDRRFQFVSTGDAFTLTDEKLGSGGPLVGIGIDGTNGYSTISLSYEGEFTDQIDRHSLNIAVRYRF